MTTIEYGATIEVLGKPKEHVEGMLKSILQKLKEDDRFILKESKVHEATLQEGTELFATFMEVELKTEGVDNITGFCFDFMPSSIEIAAPSELKLSAADYSAYLNDLQAKLHQVDMLAKQMKMERDMNASNLAALLKNNILVLLNNNKLTIEQLAGFTGVNADKLADYLDKLIDMGKIDLDGEKYTRIQGV
ncbi:hypothetical protein HOA92_04105 [archaeon]|jgi:hypothetical protein|nr:hypothetical protein [archaeon]MBT6762197.1 hypothetical protein [archaeon]